MTRHRSYYAQRKPLIRGRGTTLTISDGRQVRVLSVPAVGGQRRLHVMWDAWFNAADADDLVVWPTDRPQRY
ncbi:MAG: hypothetical protein H0W78_00635 [Planctomycetes bacterium]|nr:hypothetical protein [Planctomycetota bacterium]